MTSFFPLFAALLLAGEPSAGPAGTGVWTRIGPSGADVKVLAAAPSQPNTVYAGLVLGGVYRSSDGGRTWMFAGTGISGPGEIRSLAVDAQRPATVYAVSLGALFSSQDGGTSWRLAPHDIPGDTAPAFVAMATDAQRSGLIYVATQSGALHASNNGGRTWQDLASAPA